jgi:hypothetical protein
MTLKVIVTMAAFADKKRRRSEAQEWHFRPMNDPEQYEREAFIDRINEINFAIKEFEKLHDKSPVTDQSFRAKVLREIERSKKTLSEIQTEYEMFKKYKTRTAISE